MENIEVRKDFFIDLLKNAGSTYHAVSYMADVLTNNNFNQVQYSDLSKIKEGDKFFLVKNDSAILAFFIGKNPLKKDGLKIIGSHSDSPVLKLKPNSLIQKEKSMVLNTEVYGGAILHTWFDRPLSLAGRISYVEDGILKHKLIDLKKPLFVIPSLAIHMNRDINNGQAVEKQKTLLPVCLLDDNADDFDFANYLLKSGNVKGEAKLLAHDLYFYDYQEPLILGINEDIIQSPKLDNLEMAAASIEALLNTSTHEGVAAIFIADNEEVGSRTQQGANSLLLRQTLECIYQNLGASQAEFLEILDQGLLISADLAHAVHPHYPEKADPNHRPFINGGPVIKIAANQSYASDSKSSARFMEACLKSNVPYQIFVNHSDRPGGSTIGPISTAYLTMPTVDIGNAIWGMHSIRETGGLKDYEYMVKALTTFLKG